MTNDLRLLFHCYILIPRKCPCKTPFKTQWGEAISAKGEGNYAPPFLIAHMKRKENQIKFLTYLLNFIYFEKATKFELELAQILTW